MYNGIGSFIIRRISDGEHRLHQVHHGAPAGGVKPVLQEETDLVAPAAVVDKNRFHSPVGRSVFRQTRSPFRSGKLLMEIGEGRKLQIYLLCACTRESGIRRSNIKTNGLRPNFVLATADGRKGVSSILIRVHGGGESFAGVPGGDAHSFER